MYLKSVQGDFFKFVSPKFVIQQLNHINLWYIVYNVYRNVRLASSNFIIQII